MLRSLVGSEMCIRDRLTFGCFYESRLNRQYFQNERRYKQTQKNVNYEGLPISPQTAEITSHFYTPCTVCNFHMARRAAIRSQTKSQTDSDSYCFVVESQTAWAWQRANPRYVVMRLPDKKLAPTACSSWTSPDYYCKEEKIRGVNLFPTRPPVAASVRRSPKQRKFDNTVS